VTSPTNPPSPPSGPANVITLDAIADPAGVFAILAVDQRNTLRRMFASAGRPDTTDADLRGLKADVLAALAPIASGVLLDPTYGVPALADVQRAGNGEAATPLCPGTRSALRPGTQNVSPTDTQSVLRTDTQSKAAAGPIGPGLLVAAEPADRGDWNGEPRAHRVPHQDAAWVRALGGHAVKFLVQLRPDRPRPAGTPDLVEEVLGVVREVVADCRTHGLPSVVENLVYRLPGEDELTPRHREDVIVESARLLAETGADLLKLEYPGSAQGCRRIAEVVRGPWAVLSAGVAFDEFARALRVACDDGGASGFIAGRSLWKESVGLTGSARAEFLTTVAAARLTELIAAVDGRARPWREATTT
jgi:tagatose-1,6-bisphosphate aldolase